MISIIILVPEDVPNGNVYIFPEVMKNKFFEIVLVDKVVGVEVHLIV